MRVNRSFLSGKDEGFEHPNPVIFQQDLVMPGSRDDCVKFV